MTMAEAVDPIVSPDQRSGMPPQEAFMSQRHRLLSSAIAAAAATAGLLIRSMVKDVTAPEDDRRSGSVP